MVSIEAPRIVGLSSDQLCQVADISYRQTDYWVRNGVLEPIGSPQPGSGYVRRWSRREARVATVIGRLAALGLQVDALRHVAAMVRAMADQEFYGTLLVTDLGVVGRPDCLLGDMVIGEACYALNLDRLRLRVPALH